MVGQYQMYQANATGIDTKEFPHEGMHVRGNFWKGLFKFFEKQFILADMQRHN